MLAITTSSPVCQACNCLQTLGLPEFCGLKKGAEGITSGSETRRPGLLLSYVQRHARQLFKRLERWGCKPNVLQWFDHRLPRPTISLIQS